MRKKGTLSPMKLGCFMIVVLAVCMAIAVTEEPPIRVKATGLAPANIPPGAKARAFALRAARVQGYKKLAQAAGFGKKHRAGKKTSIRVKAFLKGARIIHKRYISDYKVEVVMEIEKKNIQHTEILLLEREIESIEAQMARLDGRLKQLKRMAKKLEKK